MDFQWWEWGKGAKDARLWKLYTTRYTLNPFHITVCHLFANRNSWLLMNGWMDSVHFYLQIVLSYSCASAAAAAKFSSPRQSPSSSQYNLPLHTYLSLWHRLLFTIILQSSIENRQSSEWRLSRQLNGSRLPTHTPYSFPNYTLNCITSFCQLLLISIHLERLLFTRISYPFCLQNIFANWKIFTHCMTTTHTIQIITTRHEIVTRAYHKMHGEWMTPASSSSASHTT